MRLPMRTVLSRVEPDVIVVVAPVEAATAQHEATARQPQQPRPRAANARPERLGWAPGKAAIGGDGARIRLERSALRPIALPCGGRRSQSRVISCS